MFNGGYNSLYMPKPGLLKGLTGKLNWSSILTNTQKTLNIINQAIPVFYQIKPMWNNTKTIFKIMGALKEDNNKSTPIINKKVNSQNNFRKERENNNNNANNPKFFL